MRRKVLLLLLTGCVLTSSEMLAQTRIEENRRRLAAKAERDRQQYRDIRPPESEPQTFVKGSIYVPDVKTYLSARSGPSSRSPELFRIYKGAGGVEIRGDTVMNGDTEWVPITVQGQQGWVAGHLLRRESQ
ncbi:SH3 domain-containing protein [Verrucomicrobiota bacterium sgz303538]